MTKQKNIAKFILKLSISSIIIYLVYRNIDVIVLLQYIKQANVLFLLFAFLMFFLSKIIEAIRVNVFYKIINLHLTEINNFRLYLLGMFYNLFLPGGIGGDSYKVYWLKKNKNVKLKPLIVATILNRINGMVALILLILISGLYISYSFDYKYLILYTIPLMYLIYYFILKWFLRDYVKILIKTSILSIIAQLLQLIAAHFILTSLGVNNAFTDYWFVFLVSAIAFVIPVTLGGLGSREFVFMYGAQLLLIDLNIAIALSLIIYIIRAIISFAGIYYVIYPNKLKNID